MLTRKAGLVAAAIAAGTAVAYVILIMSEDENNVSPVLLVTVMVVGAASAAWAGASSSDLASRRVLLGAASGILLGLGVLAIFSIGLLLLVAGFLSTVAWVRAMLTRGGRGRAAAFAAFLLAAALPLVLFLV